ncbi:SGNH/GDSL hydrolase family protein [Nocardia carnea]|uniref:SGNH/GDSL hydrolase family protein n=1 Tax=Nocardia carnea TaxID=37328 RepID=UPI002457A20B|nr:GDSL-type esterase/lipase family protein [Nocardia carnea]
MPISKKMIITAVCLALAAVLAAGATVGYLTFVRSPIDTPARACRDDATATGPVVVAAGASMTRGTLGADWVGSLRNRPDFAGHRFVNAGINGNTSGDLRERAGTDIVACHPDAVLILVGTNDVRDGVPVDTYRANLAAIVGHVTTGTTARVALISVPPLGEDLGAGINQRLAEYNRAVAEVAAAAHAGYLPFHERLADLLRRREKPPSTYDFGFGLAFRAAARHHLLRQSWDQVAHSHGLEFFVDHIHLSDRGGAILTDLTADWLRSTVPGTPPGR